MGDKTKFSNRVRPKDVEIVKNTIGDELNVLNADETAWEGLVDPPVDPAVEGTTPPPIDELQSFHRSVFIGSVSGFRYAPSTIPDEQESEIEKIVDRKMAKNMPMFQRIMSSMVDKKLQSLEMSNTRLQGVFGSRNASQHNAETLESTIRDSFNDMDFIKQVCYLDTGDDLRLIVILESEDLEPAFSAIIDRVIELEELLCDISIEPWVLRQSEVEPHHLTNAKTVFKK